MPALLPLLLLAASPAAGGPPAVISSRTVNSPFELVRGTVPLPAGHDKVRWFPETLEFELKWGIFTMGTNLIETREIVDFNGTPAYHIVSKARTLPFADKIYKVRDVNESWLRTRDRFSLGYSKKLREGHFFRDEWVLFDYPNKKFLAKRIDRDGSFEYSDGDIPGMVQDILSTVYYLRSFPLKVGDEVVVDVNTKSNWPMVVKVLKKQTVHTPAGKFRTVVLEPFLREEGIFIQKGKRLRIWVTDDKRHVPVLMKVEIIFGSIAAYLTRMEH